MAWPKEQAVLIEFDRPSAWDLNTLHAAEDRLQRTLPDGYYDGHCVAKDDSPETTFSLYGEDCSAMYGALEPEMRHARVFDGAKVTLRAGDGFERKFVFH